ncbi:hypothetical protein [Mycoplana dimorpha]|uniref:Uncharacterized protein n=1 Tax=Mycoplana dimorpha TaxID=28320 RepID=A0A2T5B7W1_MYCDI|nr:hypothetical protein [Mycoplana dimorpha]PTM95069.1 hypothetical protein C7449_104132 [Mycoplana dimorpha]
MSQATKFGVPLSGPCTPAAMAARMDDSLMALLSAHSGASRPSYAVAGTVWLDTATVGQHKYYCYDGTSDRLLYTLDTATGAITFGITDGWSTQPIGVPIPLLDNLAGVAAPPKDKAYRYVRLTAGLTGAGGYNEGLLTGETVTGTAPLVEASAVINLAGSTINGRTIDLVNTSRRFLRAGSAGVAEGDAMQNITGTLVMGSGVRIAAGTGPFHTTFDPISNGAGGGSNAGDRAINFDLSKAARTATETRPKNLGVTYYMRVL